MDGRHDDTFLLRLGVWSSKKGNDLPAYGQGVPRRHDKKLQLHFGRVELGKGKTCLRIGRDGRNDDMLFEVHEKRGKGSNLPKGEGGSWT